MKKNLLKWGLNLAVLLAFIVPKSGFSQALTGTYTIPGSYATVTAAVTALNTNGVGAGGATFNIAAGYTETISSTIVLTATGTQANPIVFQKSGVGANPVITSYTGSAALANTALPDGMLALAGSDYVTIDGINFTENAANTTAAAAMEYGIGLFKVSGTDGASNNTIRNCVITLNRVNNTQWTQGYNGSIGITVNNTTYNAATTAITVTASTGSNSYNKFYTNTIQNCNAGITLNGFGDVSPFSLGDTLNDIGGSLLSTGNTIINFGGGASATNPSLGIYAKDQWGLNISYNTINNNNGSGVNHIVTLRGIYTSNSSTNSSININNNTLTIKGGGTTSQVSVIEQNGGISGTNNTININNNTITGCQYLTATSGVFYGIYNLAAANNVNIIGNTIDGISYSTSTLTGTGTVYGIFNSAVISNFVVRVNTVKNIIRTGTTGANTIGIYNTGTVVSGIISSNIIDTLTLAGTGASGGITGIQTSGTNVTCDSNAVFYLRNTKTAGSGLIYGIFGGAASTNDYYRYNTIYNLIHSGTGLVYGYYTASAGNKFIVGNTIYNLSSSGIVVGINIASGIQTIYNNKIYDITTNTTTTSTAVGIQIGSVTASLNHQIYNNVIGRIFAPAGNAGISSNVVGINITNTTANNTFKVYHNTVYLNATSTGATGFSSACIQNTTSATATSGQLDLRNNIFVNLSTANGTGFTSVIRRTSAQLGNFGSVSNYNLLYAGIPGAKN